MAIDITVKTPSGETSLYDISKNDVINIHKGDYVFVPELSTSLKMQIVDGALSITFPDGKNVIVQNIVNLITENSTAPANGLMDKLDVTAIAFLDDNGNYKEVSFFDKLLSLIEESAAGNKPQSINFFNDEIAAQTVDKTALQDNTNNDTTRVRTAFDTATSNDTGNTNHTVATAAIIPEPNKAPTLNLDSTATVIEDGKVSINFAATDVDGTIVSTIATVDPKEGVVTVNNDGTITFTPTENFNGEAKITVTTTDNEGATATKVSTITVTSDGLTLVPTADIIDSSDTGVSSTDNITNDNTPTIRGVTENGATVIITDKDGNVVGSTIADEHGNYSITTSKLPDGTQNLTITATDSEGNSGVETQSITVDTSAQAGTVTVDTIAGDNIINASESGAPTIAVSGTANGGDIAAGDSVTVSVNGTDYTTKVGADGTYSVDVATSDLVADNSVAVSVASSDVAGNSVTSEASKDISVDTSAQAGTVTVDTIAGDNIINANESGAPTIAVSGTANGGDIAAGDSVTVSVNGTDYTTKVAADGTYSVDVATSDLVADNSVAVSVASSDVAGNSVTSEASKDISVDTQASDIDKLAITDIVDANGDYSSVTMKGTGAEAGNTISVFDEDGNKVATTTVQTDGTWSTNISNFEGTPVNDNEFFKVSETDIAGNESAQTDSTQYWHGTWSGINTESTDDFVMAGAGNDTINTDATLSGTNENGYVTSDNNDANDKLVIDGGAGNDTVTFGNNINNYSITTDSQGNIIVTEGVKSDSDGDGKGDVTELRNVETIKFADGTYDVDSGTFLSSDINATVALDATSSLTEAGGVITYTATVDFAPKTDMTITLDNDNTITIKANEKVGTTTINVDSSTYEDVYNDSISIDTSITGVSGGDFTSVDYSTNGSATTLITDTIDVTDVSITGTITSSSTIDVTNVEGAPNGINVYGIDLNGNKADLSVVSGTNHDGFGVNGVTSGSGASSELGYGNNGQSEKIVVDFDTEVKSLDVAFAWRNNSESAKVTFIDDAGKEVGSAMVSGGGNSNEALVTYYDANGEVTKVETAPGGSDKVDLSYKFEPGNGETFSKVEFSAPGYDDDYLINKINYKEVVSSDITDIIKTNGEVTLEIKTSNPPQEGTTATAIVDVAGKEYNVQLDVNGRGTLNVEANGNTDLTATVKEIVGGNFESVNVSNSSWNLADEITSLKDSISVTEDQPYSLNISDFGDKQINVSEVKITELPTNGKLYINDGSIVETVIDNQGKEVNVYANKHEVTAGTVITMVDIAAGKVVFVPDANSDADGNFKFQVDDGNGNFTDNIHTTTIDVAAVADAPTLDMNISDASLVNNSSQSDKTFDDISVHTDGGTNLDYSYYSNNSDQNLKIDNMNAYHIDTGDGNDTVSIKYSTNWKNIDLDGGNDTMVIGGSTDNSLINMGSGDDKLQIDGNIGSHIYLGSGNDEIQLSSASEVNFNYGARVDGGSGEDTLFFTGGSDSYVLQDYYGNNISFDDYNAGNFPTDHSYNIYEVDGNGAIQGNPLSIEHIENIVFEADITPSVDNTYDYSLDLNTQLTDTDGSESLSAITLSNIPDGASLKDSTGNEISANDDGSYTISPDENGNASVTLESQSQLESTQLDGIKASVTSTESNGGTQTTVEATENMFTVSEDNPSGGDSTDTVTYQENSVLDFDSLSAQNIEKINIEGNNQLDSATLDVEDVIKLTDDDNILTIIGDKGDEIGLSDDSSSLSASTDGHSNDTTYSGDNHTDLTDTGAEHTSGWEKSGTQVQDGDNTFDVWTNNDVTAYIDTDITVTDI